MIISIGVTLFIVFNSFSYNTFIINIVILYIAMVDDNFIDIPTDVNKIDGIDLSIFKDHVEQTLLNILDSVLFFHNTL